jgi:uncharacterized protein YlxW (UPF0749 family)
MSLPGWNSLPAVTEITHLCHIWALTFLLLMAIAEILAFVYNTRKDTLLVAARGAASVQQRAQRQEAERHQAELNDLRRRLDATLEQQAQRLLSPEQKQEMIAAMAAYRGQRVAVTCPIGNAEAARYAEDFVSVFAAAGWDFGGQGNGVLGTITVPTPIGIEATINEAAAQTKEVPPAYVPLLKLLGRLNLAAAERGFVNRAVPPGLIEFRVGGKLPPPSA